MRGSVYGTSGVLGRESCMPWAASVGLLRAEVLRVCGCHFITSGWEAPGLCGPGRGTSSTSALAWGVCRGALGEFSQRKTGLKPCLEAPLALRQRNRKPGQRQPRWEARRLRLQ